MSQSKFDKPNLNRAKADICYTNIRGLRTNFPSVNAFSMNMCPHFIALSETGHEQSISNREFDIPGYCPLISKYDPLNRQCHGLGVYVK